jgi:2TM domain
MSDEGDLRERAIASLKKKREFGAHLLAFVLVNVFLVAIWAVTSDGTLFWPIFPILGWGIGLVFHAWDVYGHPPGEEQIHHEMERLG